MIGSFIALCSGAFIVLAALAVEVSWVVAVGLKQAGVGAVQVGQRQMVLVLYGYGRAHSRYYVITFFVTDESGLALRNLRNGPL